jgi:hypothetical protein
MVEEVNGLRVQPKDVESLRAVREGRFFVRRTLGLRKMLEMGVFEEGGVFEAVTQYSVDGDVGDPNESNCYEDWVIGWIGDEEESEWKDEGMGEIV